MQWLRLRDRTQSSYPDFYFSLEIDRISNWTSCSGELEVKLNKSIMGKLKKDFNPSSIRRGSQTCNF